jgi:hypothetical protein
LPSKSRRAFRSDRVGRICEKPVNACRLPKSLDEALPTRRVSPRPYRLRDRWRGDRPGQTQKTRPPGRYGRPCHVHVSLGEVDASDSTSVRRAKKRPGARPSGDRRRARAPRSASQDPHGGGSPQVVIATMLRPVSSALRPRLLRTRRTSAKHFQAASSWKSQARPARRTARGRPSASVPGFARASVRGPRRVGAAPRHARASATGAIVSREPNEGGS